MLIPMTDRQLNELETIANEFSPVPFRMEPEDVLALIREIRELRAVVGRLSRTADGAAATPGMEVFHADFMSVNSLIVIMGLQENDVWGDEWGGCVEDCYSTREAAEAALGGEEVQSS